MPVENDLPDNRFRSHNRIRKSGDFAKVYQQGKTFVTPTLIFRFLPTEYPEPRLGMAVSRKVGKAVKRNLVRRRIRDAFRQKKMLFPYAYDLVVSPRRGILEKGFPDYLKSFSILIEKLHRRAKSASGSQQT